MMMTAMMITSNLLHSSYHHHCQLIKNSKLYYYLDFTRNRLHKTVVVIKQCCLPSLLSLSTARPSSQVHSKSERAIRTLLLLLMMMMVIIIIIIFKAPTNQSLTRTSLQIWCI